MLCMPGGVPSDLAASPGSSEQESRLLCQGWSCHFFQLGDLANIIIMLCVRSQETVCQGLDSRMGCVRSISDRLFVHRVI